MEVNIGGSGFLALFMVLCMISPILCQSPIPPTPDGFWYAGKPPSADSVFIEAFFDPVCPDSRDSWPPLKEALHHYGSRTNFLLHTFPLPYHDNAFATSRSLNIVNKLNPSSTYHVLEAFFKDQEQFYSKATRNLSRVDAVDKIQDFVADVVGHKYKSAIKSRFNDTSTDKVTRVGFRYGCLRGVYGTPTFFVNGFPLPDSGSTLDYKGWRKVIDPLVKQENKFEASVHLLK